MRRLLTEKENSATAVSGSPGNLNRKKVNFDIVENIDVNRLLVFSPTGQVIAEAPLNTFCDTIYIKGDHLFIVDGRLNQRILEYQMKFE